MPLKATVSKRVFQFNFRARTSRGLMRDKTSWFITVADDAGTEGIGECGPLPGLSSDYSPDYEHILSGIVARFNEAAFQSPALVDLDTFIPAGCPSVVMGFETALADLRHGGKRIIFENAFIRGEKIPINGLIWMGDTDFMMSQINIKIGEGFRCVKLKVGGLNFERECDILHYIRNRYFRDDITLRLDANGAFKLDDVLFKLDQLAQYNIHSIEQPIKPGFSEMEELCRKSPIPVALDEELIGRETLAEKQQLLQHLKPGFIVLKPMLHGGFRGCHEWITVAEQLGIGWWITSSLESSIGLNAICQFTANYRINTHQGLGTGKIYENNFQSPLTVDRGQIYYDRNQYWEEDLLALSGREQSGQDFE